MTSKTDRSADDFDSNRTAMAVILETLTDSRYRNALERLVRERGPVELRELATGLSTDGDGPDELTTTALHHVVLPKLDDVGLVTYEPGANMAELDVPSRTVRTYLDWTAHY